MIGAVRAPCTNSQPRTSTGTWFAWISTSGCPVMWVVQGRSEKGVPLPVVSFLLVPSQGLRVHCHQRGLAMRQNRRKLHSASRSACPICRVWFTNPGLPLQPVREAGAWLTPGSGPEWGCCVCVRWRAPYQSVNCYPQEPGSNQEIKEFAAGYNVKFDMYSKICVNGDDAHPLWKWMKIQPKGRGMLGK